MHDDQLERRLRSVLHEEAGRLSLTITAAELERRAALRGRSGLVNRRLTLLLAAAVAIGALGVGGLLGGLLNPPVDSSPAPTQAVVGPTDVPSTPIVAVRLPSLAELIALVGDDHVVAAQERGPADGPPPWEADILEPPATVRLDLAAVPGDVRLLFVCLGHGIGEMRVVAPSPAPIPPIRCDGRVQDVLASSARVLSLNLTEPASWRVVAALPAGRNPVTRPSEPPPALVTAEGREELVVVDQLRFEDGFGPMDPEGRVRVGVGSVGPRWSYDFSLWCEGDAAARYIHGNEIDGAFVATTTTQVACDGQVHEGELGFPEPLGSEIYLAAAPGTVLSLVVSSERPPIELFSEQPGWQLSVAIGPALHFSTQETAFTGPGVEGGGSVLVAFVCTGTEPIEVVVEDSVALPGGVVQTTGAEFAAQCTPDGGTTAQSFAVEGSYLNVRYTEVAGTWTALSFLVPDPESEAP